MDKLFQSKIRLSAFASLSLFVAFAIGSGCGPSVPPEPVGTLTGMVYSNKDLVSNCRVRIYNKQTLKSSMMTVGEDARYEFKDIVLGEYALGVITAPWYEAASPPPDRRIPLKYRDVKRSGFSITIEEGENEYDLKMKK